MTASKPNQSGVVEATILAVDDEPNVLSALKRSLRRMPWNLLHAESGQAGLEVFERHAVDMVISDYQMPGMNGIEFLNLVKERWPQVQRIMLTGNADSSMIEHLVNQSEVSRFLTKPWSDSQLKATISECVDRMKLARSNERYRQELADRNKELEIVNKSLERIVEDRTQALVQSEKLAWLGRMAGGVAHEINNPLGGILAFGQILQRDEKLMARRKDAVDSIVSCALRCKTIIDDLLSFARRPSLVQMDEIDVGALADKSWNIARLNPDLRHRELRLELADDLPRVKGQASLLQQVLINLLQNAFQATPEDKVVTLSSAREGDWVLLQVEDEGKGIPAHVLPKVFEPFFTTKDVGQGTGLGLAICYGIVQEHGGELTVESEEGAGAKFTMRLKAR